MGKTAYHAPPRLTGNCTSAAQLITQATQLAAQARQLRRDAQKTAEHIARVNLEQVCREAGTAAGNHILASLPNLAPSFATHYEVAGVRYEPGPKPAPPPRPPTPRKPPAAPRTRWHPGRPSSSGRSRPPCSLLR